MKQVKWHGFEAWQLADDRLQTLIVPALGAKIASLVDLSGPFEWMAPPTHAVRKRIYGDSFVEHDLAGWDEMFPTITACPSPFDASVMLPDHGEVWALPWEVVATDANALTLAVEGRAMAYRLTRTASLSQGVLRLHYHLANRSSQAMPFLWAAHPLFRVETACELALPAVVQQVVNTAAHPRLGAPDRLLAWPDAQLEDGSTLALNHVGTPETPDYRKVYTRPEQVIGAGRVRQGRHSLTMRWDTATAPYLGIWVDERTYTAGTTTALEPASGYYDALDLALRNERVSVVPPGGETTWWLSVSFDDRSAL
jgi:galactose mutarotase-like enzyme